MTYSKGISWIEDCRIPYVDEKDKEKNTDGLLRFNDYRAKLIDLGYGFSGGEKYEINTQGRFPANLLVCDDMLNDGIITKQTKWNKIHNDSVGGTFGGGNMNPNNSYGDKGTNSRYYDIDKWFDKIINYE